MVMRGAINNSRASETEPRIKPLTSCISGKFTNRYSIQIQLPGEEKYKTLQEGNLKLFWYFNLNLIVCKLTWNGRGLGFASRFILKL